VEVEVAVLVVAAPRRNELPRRPGRRLAAAEPAVVAGAAGPAVTRGIRGSEDGSMAGALLTVERVVEVVAVIVLVVVAVVVLVRLEMVFGALIKNCNRERERRFF
jgi:hypothetical protein